MSYEGIKEECGVFGIYDNDGLDTALLTYYGLYSLQHRGQESCGIALLRDGEINQHKDMGLVPEVFNEELLAQMKGNIAVGHVRYSTTGASKRENASPLVLKYSNGNLALAHNGNLVNDAELREELEAGGAIFQTSIDSEVMAYIIAKYHKKNTTLENAVSEMMNKISGSYALILMGDDKLIGARDPYGLRPLSLGRIENSYVLASETCALDTVGAEFIRDVRPGEILCIDKDGLHSDVSHCLADQSQVRMCIFEYIYFARPDSIIEGVSVYEARKEAGRMLAKQHPVEADLVTGVPDSGLAAALGYAEESGIPYGDGLIKNRYIGRTFIQPEQSQRETGVMLKLNALKSSVAGKRIVLIDDSIVRGTTSGRIVQMLKDAGAKEVHLRISSPPFKWPCFFGTDIPSKKQLVAVSHSIEQICKLVGADSLGYLDIEDLGKMALGANCGFCTACFSGKYPMKVPLDTEKARFDKCD